MPINLTCPTCERSVEVPAAAAGKKTACPHCSAALIVPEVTDSAAPPHDAELPETIDITRPPAAAARERDMQEALNIVRILYVMVRDDWRRLFTCAHLWLLVPLFFLPWLNVSCNDRSLMSQSGLQVCHGGTTVNPKLDKLARNNGNMVGNANLLKPRLDERPSWSVLTIIYAVFALLGGGMGFFCIGFVVFRARLASAAVHLFSLALGSAAFSALALQMVIGFPIEKHTRQQIDKARDEQNRRNGQFGAMPRVNDEADAMFDIDTKYTGWLWLSFWLAFLSVPVFFLEFAILAVGTVRHHLRGRPDTG